MEAEQPYLDRWVSFVREIRSTNKSLIKEQIVKQYKDLIPLWRVILNPQNTTGVTRKGILQFSKRSKVELQGTIFQTLEDLTARRLTGNQALSVIKAWISKFPDYREELLCLFEGNPKIGISLQRMNKQFDEPICAPFEPALAQKFNPKYFDLEKDEFDISLKYDGVRAHIFFGPEGYRMEMKLTEAVAFSRNGNELVAFQNKLKEIYYEYLLPRRHLWPNPDGFNVVDVEACWIDAYGKEDFKKAVSLFRKSKPTEEFMMIVLDVLDKDLFDEVEPNRGPLLFERHKQAEALFKNIPHFRMMDHVIYTPENMVLMEAKKEALGAEGLMLRRNTYWKGGRSYDIMKKKEFHNAEYRVIGITTGTKNMLNAEGLMIPTPCMAAVRIQHKDNYVLVGSGWSDEDRVRYLDHPEEIIGKIIEVQYFEETLTKGKYSLRFPTVKYVWGPEREL